MISAPCPIYFLELPLLCAVSFVSPSMMPFQQLVLILGIDTICLEVAVADQDPILQTESKNVVPDSPRMA